MSAQQTTMLSIFLCAPIFLGLALFLGTGQVCGADSFAPVSSAMQECIT
jgi:hypothetical protein